MDKKTKEEDHWDSLKNLEDSSLSPFEWISKKINVLLMYAKIINKHPNDLEGSYKKIIFDKGIKPSEGLMEYIILEIAKFYELSYYTYKKEIEYPESSEVVRDFRNKVIVHISNKTHKKYIGFYQKFGETGMDKIFADYLIFKDLIFKKLKGE